MKPFVDYFSDDQIIRLLCKDRIKLAASRQDRQYVDRLTGHQRPDRLDFPVSRLLPARKRWAQFRPRQRRPELDVNLVSLVNATRRLREAQPELPWAVELREFIEGLRARVFSASQFSLRAPEINWKLKKSTDAGKEYRALCRFDLEDNIIIGLCARYLKDFVDPGFETSSYAFRARTSDKGTPDHHQAFEEIFRLKASAPRRDFYVMECDIRGFYDSVHHDTASQALLSAVDHLQRIIPEQQFHPRARVIYEAFLDCYDFPQNVLTAAGPRLRSEEPNGFFPWPEEHEALGRYFANPRAERIGVPQGGAISCVIANLVLDLADKRVARVSEQLHCTPHYLRYCDDMILLARQQSDCQRASDAYLSALEELKLPYHQPKTVENYGKDFWDYKSKAPYRWTGVKGKGCVPWVQFVGYQVRYDGLVRIKKGSFDKQMEKITTTVNQVKSGLMAANRQWSFPRADEPSSVMATQREVIASARQKLTSMGVGRVNLHQPAVGPLPKCWANGYKALHGKPLVPTFLRKFDRQRERQIRRLERAKISYGPGRRVRQRAKGGRPAPKGYAFSYTAQFTNNGGADLVNNPYRDWRFNLMRHLRLGVRRVRRFFQRRF